eukprot:697871-Pleurochrysis_carterae.AAC.1
MCLCFEARSGKRAIGQKSQEDVVVALHLALCAFRFPARPLLERFARKGRAAQRIKWHHRRRCRPHWPVPRKISFLPWRRAGAPLRLPSRGPE